MAAFQRWLQMTLLVAALSGQRQVAANRHLRLGSTRQGQRASLLSKGGERILCKVGPRSSFNGSVQVWVDSGANTRGLTFTGDGLGEQTLVKCAGALQGGCADESRPTDPGELFAADPKAPECDSVQCPCEAETSSLQFSYMQRMMDEFASRCVSSADGRQLKVLLVGLGGGALFNFILAHCPAASIEAVEYDPRVVEVATRFFGVKAAPGRSSVETGDGGAAVAERASSRPGQYDIVLVDCFQSGGQVPASCRSDAFIRNIGLVLRGGGRAIQQIWSPQYEKVIKRYQELFGMENVKGTDIDLGLNHLIVASKPGSSDFSF